MLPRSLSAQPDAPNFGAEEKSGCFGRDDRFWGARLGGGVEVEPEYWRTEKSKPAPLKTPQGCALSGRLPRHRGQSASGFALFHRHRRSKEKMVRRPAADFHRWPILGSLALIRPRQPHVDGPISTCIGIGGTVTRPPLPHHRRCGSAYGGSEGYASPSNRRGRPSESK